MSRIYDALKKLEAQRHGGANGSGNGSANGSGNGHGNGNGRYANGNGHGNGNGNGHGNGNGRRWNSWRRLFQNGTNGSSGNGGHYPRVALDFKLGPEVEEAYQRLGTNLLVGPADAAQQPKLLGVTASRHGEGTTTTAAVFASILVRRRGGRVAVVEANFRTPSCDVVFGVEHNGGFAEFIEGRAPLSAVVHQSQQGNLFVITCGHSESAPSALFDSPGLPAALQQLREQFDFVIFDLPPVNVYSDASILGPRLDAALIVIEADRTRIPEVERTRRSLERVGVNLVGSVLNRRRNYIPAFLEEML
jgi:capsular exopolysaccharide synthesis family protein